MCTLLDRQKKFVLRNCMFIRISICGPRCPHLHMQSTSQCLGLGTFCFNALFGCQGAALVDGKEREVVAFGSGTDAQRRCGYYCSADVLASNVVVKTGKIVLEVRNPKTNVFIRETGKSCLRCEQACKTPSSMLHLGWC